jgi:hypothetical protein
LFLTNENFVWLIKPLIPEARRAHTFLFFEAFSLSSFPELGVSVFATAPTQTHNRPGHLGKGGSDSSGDCFGGSIVGFLSVALYTTGCTATGIFDRGPLCTF